MALSNRRSPRPADLLVEDQRDLVVSLLRDQLQAFDGNHGERDSLADAVAKVERLLPQHTASRSNRSFWMVYPEENFEVVNTLLENSKRPRVAMRVWALIPMFVDRHTGELLITRQGLIARARASAYSVNAALRELVKAKALRVERDPEPGKQGRGTARYFVNASVGTHLKHGERDKALSTAEPVVRTRPALKVVRGSVPRSERRSRAPSFSPAVL